MVDGAPGALGEFAIDCQDGDIDSDPAMIQSLEMGVPHVEDQDISKKNVRLDL